MRKGTSKEMEKRQSIRLEKTLPVKLDLAHIPSPERSFEALSRNISEGGMFIETDSVEEEKLALGKEVIFNLEIELLGRAQRIKPRARIVWISRKSRAPRKKRNGLGIEFIQIQTQEKRAISLFISKEMLAQTELVEKEISVVSREQKLTDRQRRNLQILDVIRKNRLISRAEISKHTGINIVTVSNYIDNYLKKGLVFERGLDISTGGRRPELIELNPQYGYMLGVDLGCLDVQSAVLQVVVTDFTASLKAKVSKERKAENIDECLDIIKKLIAQLLASDQAARKRFRGIGMAISGIMDKFGGTVRNPFTGDTFANYVTIKKELEDEFGLPVFIENAANCAFFAEKWIGISLEIKTAANILYIFSDNQCAIMIKDELYTGASKSAGHLNFASPRNNQANAGYCWMNSSFDCLLRTGLRDVEKSKEQKESLDSIGTKLGAKIAYLVNIFNPQVVIIGNNFSQLGDTFLDTIRRTVNRWAFRESANIVRIIPATLNTEAAALGAASLVIEATFANI